MAGFLKGRTAAATPLSLPHPPSRFPSDWGSIYGLTPRTRGRGQPNERKVVFIEGVQRPCPGSISHLLGGGTRIGRLYRRRGKRVRLIPLTVHVGAVAAIVPLGIDLSTPHIQGMPGAGLGGGIVKILHDVGPGVVLDYRPVGPKVPNQIIANIRDHLGRRRDDGGLPS